MKEAKSRSYDKDFKLNATKLYQSSGKSYLVFSREQGISKGTLISGLGARRKMV